MTDRPPLPDQAAREAILTDLDRCLLVEAAAGTGKTTSMVGRMVALLAAGRCTVETLAAVTFTRKAAAELKARFRAELRRAARDTDDAAARARLNAAHRDLAQCFIGTIHAFCARLLRERPVEAGLDPAFAELDATDDARLRAEAWTACLERLRADDPADLLGRLDRLGLAAEDLGEAFQRFADFPDVAEWPAPGPAEPPDPAPLLAELETMVARMRGFAGQLPAAAGEGRLAHWYRRLPPMHDLLRRTGELATPARLLELLERFDRGVSPGLDDWPGETKQARAATARAERDAWDAFRERVVQPAREVLLGVRYVAALALLDAARSEYDARRRARGVLSFQDLLLKTSALLRDNPHVRAGFARRFTHLLVDEFQDTDPVQAEILLYLCATDPAEIDWRACRPRPGSLFVVGDPKQSIYRFRRADIVTYNEVRELMTAPGGTGPRGRRLELAANFRCPRPVIDWVNQVFAASFPETATATSPAYVRLEPGRPPGATIDALAGVRVLRIPADAGSRNHEAVAYEAERIARTIAALLERDDVRPDDVLILTRYRRSLARYARALQDLGIPHRVTGGTALNAVRELHLLYRCLAALVRPDDPVALVAALRSELFGFSDAELFEYRQAGGCFDLRWSVPTGLDAAAADLMREALARLREYSAWLDRRPPLAALERVAEDLGLFAAAAARTPGGDVQAGSLGKALELLRATGADAVSPARLTARLGELVDGAERHDGISALGAERPAVRIMNLHQAKGLEAPVVFLADPTGARTRAPDVHVDRAGGPAGAARGHLLVSRQIGWGRKLLARPGGGRWSVLAEREAAFREAEEVRLRYVAATRARRLLVVTQRAKGNHDNPWAAFDGHLADVPEIPDPGATSGAAAAATPVPGDPDDATADAGLARPAPPTPPATPLAPLRVPTYAAAEARLLARELAAPEVAEPDAAPTAAPDRPGDLGGIAWGSAIHQLLELALRQPEAELDAVARDALAEHDLDPDQAPAALDTVRAVLDSALWQRAGQSAERLAEVPFVLPADAALGLQPPRPTVVRGCIDLAFREPAGWVLVDYKTDRVRGAAALAERARQYAPQVELYARAWTRITGAPVSERGLFFLWPGVYLPLQ